MKNALHSSSQPVSAERPPPSLEWIIFASSTGTLIEWYDFYLYQNMAVLLASRFFPQSTHNGMLGLLLSMATLGLGFAIRPLGGLVFGSLGDRIGRKYTFLMTLLLMGITTTLIGVLPTFDKIGYLAPVGLLILRLLQGLAAGGEIGGAGTYVAEHAPRNKRGWYTGIINAMSPAGTLTSLGVLYITRHSLDAMAFESWGWRVPFLISGVLVLISLYLRMRLQETPVFEALRLHHQGAKSPVRELLFDRTNFRRLLIGTFGATVGQAALGITAMAYSISFMQAVLKVDAADASAIFFIAVIGGIPFYLLSGWLSDKIGRRPLIIAGATCALIFYIPIYAGMKAASSPPDFWVLVALNWIQIVFVGMILGPTLAFLAEIFPARVRTTGLTFSYNLSNGFLNGFSPLIAFGLIAATGNIYLGLVYPMALALITIVVNVFFAPETKGADLNI
ncbi:MFS transporter [Paraburkholderia sp. 22B1P]|uniref:MFS transporter n=1 Tax=Paraburkholderia sp. 22B1P TaxID=3080498 RepID=UPI00308693CC|nr:MFS transporter [Paraburkholderia sp. 22B1P]